MIRLADLLKGKKVMLKTGQPFGDGVHFKVIKDFRVSLVHEEVIFIFSDGVQRLESECYLMNN